jgi:hypothetical protein
MKNEKRASKPDEKTQIGTKKWCISEFHPLPPLKAMSFF